LLPFVHYLPETEHSHDEVADAHQHQERYHYATLEVYAHLINGHFFNKARQYFSPFHCSEDENGSEYFFLNKNFKSFKQSGSHFEFSNSLVLIPIGSESISIPSHAPSVEKLVIGGILSSTVLTVLVLPALYRCFTPTNLRKRNDGQRSIKPNKTFVCLAEPFHF
jgi:hypothetical protein